MIAPRVGSSVVRNSANRLMVTETVKPSVNPARQPHFTTKQIAATIAVLISTRTASVLSDSQNLWPIRAAAGIDLLYPAPSPVEMRQFLGPTRLFPGVGWHSDSDSHGGHRALARLPLVPS